MTKITIAEKAEILSQALPYIQKYNEKIIVISYQQSAVNLPNVKEALMRDIVLLSQIGVKIVLVHGCEATCDYCGDNKEKLSDIVKTNKEIVHSLEAFGSKAIGISAVDGRMIELNSQGQIEKVNTKIITDLIASHFVTVIHSTACKQDGSLIGLNFDAVAARIAGDLHAASLIALTSVRGILQDSNDENSLLPYFNVSETPRLIKEGLISGNMVSKITCYVEAIRLGVNKAFVIDGGMPHSILIETLSDEGIGTMIFQG